MDNGVVLESKLLIPEVPKKSLYSKRIKVLDIARYRLAVIVAPAGFGKTTAVLLSLQKFREDTRWYRLEKEDNFLMVFYSHLITTLFSATISFEPECMRTLRGSQDLEKDYSFINAQIAQDAHNFFRDRDNKLFLVLDDFHNVADNEIIRDGIRYFTVNFPECISIIVTSRSNPYIVSDSLLMRSDIKLIDSKSLSFTKEETDELIQTKYKLKLTKEQSDYVFDNAEGWIAGIYMLCHSLEITGDLSAQQFREEKQNLFSRFLYRFLMDIEEEKRKLLIHLAHWEDFSASEVKEYFHIADITEFVKWLENSNLYIQKISARPVRYRFHALFREELERIFHETAGESEIREYFRSLGEYFRDINYPKSIRFYRKGGFEKEALHIAEERGREFFLLGKPDEMFYLLYEFPPDIIDGSPYLLLFRGMLYMNIQKEQSLKDIIHAMDGLRVCRDYSFLMNAFGMLMVIAYQNNDFSIMDKAAGKLPVAAMFLSGSDVRIKLIVSQFISFMGEDKLKPAGILRAFLDKRKIPEDMWHYSYLMIRGIYYYRCGELERSLENLRSILAHPIGKNNEQWRIIGLVSCCNSPILKAEGKLMQEFVDEFMLLGEKYNSDFSYGYGYYISAFEKYQRGEVGDALEAMQNSIDYYQRYGGDLLVYENELYMYLWGEKKTAREDVLRLENLVKQLDHLNPGDGLGEYAKAIAGVYYKRLKEYDMAKRYLLESLHISKRKGARQDVCGIYMQLADLYRMQENTSAEKKYLLLWLTASKEKNFIYWKESDIGTIQRTCDAVKLHFFDAGSVKEDTGISVAKYIEGIERMYQLRGSKKKDSNNANIQISMLGTFELRGPGFKLEEKDFKTRKISGLLKYILANERKSFLSRERLASVFWPEAESRAAFASLRVALYELRKLLSNFEIGLDSKNAIIKEKKEGFYLGEAGIFKLDTEEFEEKYKLYKNKEYTSATTILEEICCLYRGEFLQGEEYDDKIMVLKEHYSTMFFDCAYDLAKEYMNSNQVEDAEKLLLRGLLLDPFNAKCCNMLVNLYLSTNQKNRAVLLEKQFRQRYEREMT